MEDRGTTDSPEDRFVSTGPGRLAEIASGSGIERIHMVAWRDLDDPEAGGSELHAHEIAKRWAAAGIEVTQRTSGIAGQGSSVQRSGYRAERRSGRYGVFPSVIGGGLSTRRDPGSALVEIWNGMPFFSPLWFRGPRITVLHHVHDEMWQMTLPGLLGSLGDTIERRLAPPFYRRERIVTLSASSRHEIVERLRLPPDHVVVAPPGISSRYRPGSNRHDRPLVVAVGRLVPVKRVDLLIKELAQVRRRVPDLEAVIIGEGYERPALEALRRSLGADTWLSMPGFVEEDKLISWYQQAWVVASASLREGWGMTLTEAAACATPSVATNIAGHRDAVSHYHSGILVDDVSSLSTGIIEVLTDERLRRTLQDGALSWSEHFSWDATAQTALEQLAISSKR